MYMNYIYLKGLPVLNDPATTEIAPTILKWKKGLSLEKKQHKNKNKNKISLQGFGKEILQVTISRGSSKGVCFTNFF